MAQSDQTVQNATFPTVRADINDNLAALFSQSSGATAPATTVAFQPWIDTSSSPAVWKVRNAANSGWITIGVLDATFAVGGLTPIANGGTGATTANAALNALLPSQSGNASKYLQTDGTNALWALAATGASVQVITSSGTYTPSATKTVFLVFATGGGGGGGGSGAGSDISGASGGGGGTAIRMYSTAEMGANATVTIGAAGTAGNSGGGNGGTGGTTTFDPGGTGLTITGVGGGGGVGSSDGSLTAGSGGGATNSLIDVAGQSGQGGINIASGTAGSAAGGASFWGGGRGRGGRGAQTNAGVGLAGTAGVVFVLEF